MSTMTLEQLRDRLREVERNPHGGGIIWPGEAGDMADALDVELASREVKGDAVAYVSKETGDLVSAEFFATLIEKGVHKDSYWPLYEHPAAQEAAKPVEQAMVSAEGCPSYYLDCTCEKCTARQAHTIPPKPEQAVGDGVDEPPLAGRWHHGNGFMCCGTFRVAREDWEAGVCAAPGMRAEVFDWICARLNADAPRPAIATAGDGVVRTTPVGECEHPRAHGNPNNAYTFICDTCGKEIV